MGAQLRLQELLVGQLDITPRMIW